MSRSAVAGGGGAKPHVVVLGSSFAGLTAARFIREQARDAVRMTVIDRSPHLMFVPNVPMEVLADRDPAVSMQMDTVRFYERDGTDFLTASVEAIDPDARSVTFVPNDRAGSAPETIAYDFLVIALGNRLAYDRIEGFGEFGHTVSSAYYGNKLRKKLAGSYRGGPIAIGSARFHQGLEGKPDWLPVAEAACEGPPLELGLAMDHWLRAHSQGDAHKITLFSPAKVIAEDAGTEIVEQLLSMAGEMGFGYRPGTDDVRRVTADGVELADGSSLEAEIAIVFPDWVPHDFLRDLPITDELGFVLTGPDMRNRTHPEVFAVGDAAALTVPKLGSLGHQQAEIVSRQIAVEVGALEAGKAGATYRPEVVCFGDMGGHKGFYIHSDTWYGGDTSVLKMGYAPWAAKMAFKEMYFRTGGKPASWGMPATEWTMDRLPLP